MSGNGSNGNGTTREIVAKLWSLCHVLRDDGVSYGEYVTELTFLLFVKMLAETGHEERLPKAYRWAGLARRGGLDQLEHYRQLLLDLGNPAKTKDALVLAIFTDAQTKLRKPTNLKTLTDAIDKLDWFSAREEGLGNLYEGLLEKNAAEKKSGAGQYFTPRPLIDCIVRLVKPQPGEVVQDPAAGTAGFLVAADRYIKDKTDDLYKLSEAKAFFQRHNAFVGMELVPDTHRLCLMNLMLHGIESQVESGDSLSPDGERLGKADVILTNPPFGTKKGGGRPTRADFSITAETSNKQLAFVEHVVRTLKPGGRAAIVLPDGVLGETNVGRRLRSWMMELCNVHTILRLPTGIFYAIGVRTNIIFLTRGKTDHANTKGVWVYDLRANMNTFGKNRPLTVADFAAFEKAFGKDILGKSPRKDEGKEGRFRFFSREQIATRNDDLDIAWLRDTNDDPEDQLTEPEDIAAAITGHMRAASDEIEAINDDLGDGTAAVIQGTNAIATLSLSDVAKNIQYGYTAKSSSHANGPKYLRITDIQNGTVDWSQVPHCEMSSEDRSRFILNNYDIVFARSGATVGKSFLVDGNIPSSVFASYLIRVTFSRRIDPRYGYYFFQSPQYWQQIMEGATGTGQPNFNGAKLGALKVPVPSLALQHRIVARLDALLGRSKAARDELARVNTLTGKSIQPTTLLDRLDQALLARAFRGELVPATPDDDQNVPRNQIATLIKRRARVV